MKRLAGIAAVAFLNPAFAADWEPVASGDSGLIASVDVSSMSGPRNLRKAWVRYSYKDFQKGDASSDYRQYRSKVALAYFDCPGKRSATAKIVTYYGENGSGENLSSKSDPNFAKNLDEVVPDSIGEALLERVCQR